MPQSPVSIAVIGAGMIGRKHAGVVHESKNAILTAIVDPTPAGRDIARLHDCEHFSSVQDLLELAAKVDAAIICTPNETHVAISEQLAAHGVHLLIEKPMSADTAEGQRLLRVCNDHGVKVCVGHHRRFHASIQAAKHALDVGSIGRILGVSGLWASLKPDAYFEENGRWRAGEKGGIVLINLVHDLDLLQYFFGTIVRVYAEQAPSIRGNVAEEGVALTLRFENGVVGTFLALDNSPSPFSMERGTGENPVFPFTGKDCYRVFGSDGVLSVPDGTLSTPIDLARGWHSELNEQKLQWEKIEVYEKQLENLVGVVRGYEEPTCSGASGLAAVAACEAVRNALITRMPVGVEVASEP